MSTCVLYYKHSSHLFATQGRPVDNTCWGTCIVLIDKGPRKELTPSDSTIGCTIIPSWRSVKELQSQKMPKLSQETKQSQVANMRESENSPKATSELKPKMLDLFSGTGSVGKVFEERGYEVTSVDIEKHFKPTIVADVLTWDYKAMFKPGHFEIIFCSPPCSQFSRAKTTAPAIFKKGMH